MAINDQIPLVPPPPMPAPEQRAIVIRAEGNTFKLHSPFSVPQTQMILLDLLHSLLHQAAQSQPESRGSIITAHGIPDSALKGRG